MQEPLYNTHSLNPAEQKDYSHLANMPVVRVSVANLISKIICSDGREGYLGILYDKALQKGITQYIAVGGGAELFENGMNFLKHYHEADPYSFEGSDARFKLPGKNVAGALIALGNQRIDSQLIERGVERELFEEFIDEQKDAVLTNEEISLCKLEYMGSYRQPINTKQGGSMNTSGSVTARLFFVYNMLVTPKIFDKIKSHESMRILTAEEVATTEGGSKTGYTSDGAVIGDNLFLINR
jgi:hypothetical protein